MVKVEGLRRAWSGRQAMREPKPAGRAATPGMMTILQLSIGAPPSVLVGGHTARAIGGLSNE